MFLFRSYNQSKINEMLVFSMFSFRPEKSTHLSPNINIDSFLSNKPNKAFNLNKNNRKPNNLKENINRELDVEKNYNDNAAHYDNSNNQIYNQKMGILPNNLQNNLVYE